MAHISWRFSMRRSEFKPIYFNEVDNINIRTQTLSLFSFSLDIVGFIFSCRFSRCYTGLCVSPTLFGNSTMPLFYILYRRLRWFVNGIYFFLALGQFSLLLDALSFTIMFYLKSHWKKVNRIISKKRIHKLPWLSDSLRMNAEQRVNIGAGINRCGSQQLLFCLKP